MDFVTIRDLRTQPDKVWKKLSRARELVVTRNGKPFALLTETTPMSLDEDLATLHRLRFGRALSEIREQARTRGLDKLSLKDIDSIIRKARKARRASGGA
jgi:antitoxin (DNA-binding transcriptional repressor) of toxin-antitoxin stability system